MNCRQKVARGNVKIYPIAGEEYDLHLGYGSKLTLNLGWYKRDACTC
jgi:hypothetical protein